MTQLVFRDVADDADRFFVVSAWTQSYRTAFTSGIIQAEDWYAIMDAQVAKAMARPDVRTVLACMPGATDRVADILGFITADVEEQPALVYYVYVKDAYRRGGHGRLWAGPGVARQLFAAIGVDPARRFNYVCSTPVVRELNDVRKLPMAKWQPLLGRFPKSERRSRSSATKETR
jgi:hypothetical protein